MSFAFDRAAHRYTLDGKELVSVTTVLGLLENFDRVPAAVLERARQRGARVHAAINAYNRGAFSTSGDVELESYVDAWARFLSDASATVVASEQPVYHRQLGYAGTPDCVLSWRGDRRLLIPDIKTSYEVPMTVGAQTAAYAVAYDSRRSVERACVHLKPDGSYSLHMRDDQADWSLFLSTLNVYRFLEKNR